jgi:hypothetical protein
VAASGGGKTVELDVESVQCRADKPMTKLTSNPNGKDMDGAEDDAAGTARRQQMPPASVMTRLILIMVWRKLIRNPNTYSSLIGLTWSLVAFRYVRTNGSSSPHVLCFTHTSRAVLPLIKLARLCDFTQQRGDKAGKDRVKSSFESDGTEAVRCTSFLSVGITEKQLSGIPGRTARAIRRPLPDHRAARAPAAGQRQSYIWS